MITIRSATAEDKQTIRNVIRESFLSSYVHFLPKERIEQSIRNDRAGEIARNEGHLFTIAEMNGTPAGVMLLKDNFVEQLFTHPDFMGVGVGSALLEHAENQAREKGHDRLTLNCFADNEKALAFYKAKGFTIEKSVEEKNHMPGIFNCTLAKNIQGHQ